MTMTEISERPDAAVGEPMTSKPTKRDLIERGLDVLDPAKMHSPAISTAAGGLKFTSMLEVMDFSKAMSTSGNLVPEYLRGNPGGCLGITFQAIEWRMSPFQVANKSYEVNDRIAYESQLIHAVIEARAPLQHRLMCSYEGELIYDEVDSKDEETGEIFKRRVLNWRKSTRKCTIAGDFTNGDTRDYTSPQIGDIKVKNSPLWRDDPDQQLFYYASRSWARKWCPDVLMGIYTREELAERPNIGREDEDTAPGLHARLAGAAKADEGHKPGFAESELDQVAAASGGQVIEASAEAQPEAPPEAGKAAGKRAKAKHPAKAPEPKETAPEAPPATPKTVKQWTAYCMAWIAAEKDPDEIAKRWLAERKLRNEIGVTADERKPVEAAKDKRLVKLGA